MTDRIIKILRDCAVDTWRITETYGETAELYFVKKKLDMPRIKNMHGWVVEVFCDFDENGMKLRGSSNALLSPGMTDEEIKSRINGAVYAASFAKNPFFELPKPVKEEHRLSDSDLAEMSPKDAVIKAAGVIMDTDCAEDAFVNSSEIFAAKSTVRMIASNGLDVCFDSCRLSGELVAQCPEPNDVEQYRGFSYEHFDENGLRNVVLNALRDVRYRAQSTRPPVAGKYDVILKGEHIRTVLDYYADRASANMIYPGYSAWKTGMDIQGSGEGERLDLTFVPTDPYSSEGIPMIERSFVCDGVLQCIQGPARFCGYLGIEPTGYYEKIRCGSGTKPAAELEKKGVLELVSFSDFQMDSFDGHFKGEIRLAFLHNGDGSFDVLSGGSVNGSLPEAQGSLTFSAERYSDSSYDGPAAVLIPGVMIAGA